ncbi:NAD(P)H-dependent oxidoreductase [Fusobacterium simiae]|uniref:NAD(P)H-dependent oxidoreductase n=1 Tax=Fusobacterium simiae TaxID=855 RepID=A0ABT4DKQ3_FUSSI|nr:NAD(P)H-dependent oxidoreductase [Fusobacterium simiae]MCY7009167.1 NAD(P)H-dependent oxidoreductase [Fusobacterium simiae]
MKKILIVSGHPDLENSTANRIIIENLSKKLPEATIHRLDKIIENGNFNIEKEQTLLLEYDTYIFVSPFYWYSWSALMKKWVDEVFTHGFAHGSTGKKVQGKNILLSFTTGAPFEEYKHEGSMRHTVEEFLYPVEGLAHLCGMNALPTVYSNDMTFIPTVHDDNRLKEIQKKAEKHANRIVELVK